MNTLRTCENSAGRVPDASKITRFKQEFIDDLQLFLDSLVDLTEPILQEIDGVKASMTIFDTTGLEAYVTENNPKYANKKIRYYSNDLELYIFSKTIAWDYEQQRPYKGDTIREERRMYLHLYFNPDILSDDGRIFDKKLDKLKEELLSGKRVPEHEKDYKKYKAIDLFKEIFREERKLKDACPDDRLKGRQEKVRPVFEELSAYIKSFGADDFDQSGLMYDALQYFSNQDKYLRGFLDGPLIPAHNSVCERDNAVFAVLRNNIKFIDSISIMNKRKNMTLQVCSDRYLLRI